MDVATVLAGEPISFSMEKGARPLGIRRLPKFTFHDTGLRARTSECVLKVEKFREENPIVSLKTDERMSLAARNAMEGLALFDRGEGGLGLLSDAMKRAQECFYEWQLVPGEARRMEDELVRQGALAAKLTGAGGGGFVVALWP
jgi:mevalonate kinase